MEFLLFFAISILVYLAPAFIASTRGHHQAMAILCSTCFGLDTPRLGRCVGLGRDSRKTPRPLRRGVQILQLKSLTPGGSAYRG